MIQMTSLKCIALKRMMTFEAFVWGWLSFKLVVTFACEHCSVQWWYRWRVSITMYIQNMGIQFQIWNFLRCFLFAFAVCTCDLCAINDCSHLCTSVHMWFSLSILTAWCRETRTLQTCCGEVVLGFCLPKLTAAVITCCWFCRSFLRCFLFAFAVCTCDLCAINDCSHLCTSVHMWFSLCILTAWCRETRTLQTCCGEVVLGFCLPKLTAAVITCCPFCRSFLRCFLFAFAVCTCDLCAINDCSHLCTSVHM